jgi:poly [ADP-ribose] polymerase
MAHIIEVAKSGRAACRTCRKPIAKGELRFGEEAPNQFGDAGEASYRWHHLKCAAQKHTDDLRATLATFAGDVPEREEIERIMADADAKKPPPFPYADKAPTGRARCQGCGESIAKDAIRVAFEREIDRGGMMTKGAGYLHPACATAYLEQQGSTHAELTEGLRKNTRDLSPADLESLFAEV